MFSTKQPEPTNNALSTFGPSTQYDKAFLSPNSQRVIHANHKRNNSFVGSKIAAGLHTTISPQLDGNNRN